MGGFIQLMRDEFDDELWQERRTFSRFEAWLDLLRMMAWTERKVTVGGVMTDITTGQCAVSERMLAVRWGWSGKKVRIFEKWLQMRGWVEVMPSKRATVITITKEAVRGAVRGAVKDAVNTDDYQQVSTSEEAPKEAVRGAVRGAVDKKKSNQKKNNIIINNQELEITRTRTRGTQGQLPFSGGIEERHGEMARGEWICPTLEEVVTEFRKRGRDEEEARHFFDYYSMIGWKNSRGMKLMRLDSAVNNWIRYETRRRETDGRSRDSRERQERFEGYARVAAKFREQAHADIRGEG